MSAPSRFRFAGKIAGIHLGVSLLVAILVACLVFFVWYPHPFRELMGSFNLFWLVMAVDVICGPALTFVLANPRKKRPEVLLDFSLVILIQISALLYGMYTVYTARPVALAYQVDRLRVLTQDEIRLEELPQARPEFRHLPRFGMLHVAARPRNAADDNMEMVDIAMQGYDIGQRPGWWIPYAEAEQAIRMQARPLSELAQRVNEQKRKMLEEAIRTSQLPMSAYRYLPLTSADQWEWTAILDGDMQIIAAVPVDGFQ
ncbi:MAG: TfpX/TfpZ family type IV pilin accessory protein [Cardiobacteriaceae bacterium]|nr:TfpX/TfpZ family type IV pilin accessory protein [Cardiobacteriaceae bacterium]